MTSNRKTQTLHGRKHAIKRHYEPRIAPGRPSHEVLDWASAQSQQARFEILVQNVPMEGRSLLDVGCGLGDLLGFITARNIHCCYLGVDILDKMVQAARRAQPQGQFIHADIFASCPFGPSSFDVVFCSGAFNLNLGNNEQFVKKAVETFLMLSRRHVVFNMLHHRARGGEQTYFYYDPTKVLAMLKPLGCEVSIIDDYLHNDFTVICEKAG